jgi:uncharacterized damage-inducible protein DinB
VNLKDLQILIDYHYWAQHRLFDAVEPLPQEQFMRDMGSSFRSIRDTLAHNYFAEWIWLRRWQGESPTAMPAPDMFPDLATVRRICEEHESKMRTFWKTVDGEEINRVIPYKSTAGQEMSSVLWHMLQHVVNHAQYHRGQVTTMIRQLGAVPPKSLDLIAFYREGGGA